MTSSSSPGLRPIRQHSGLPCGKLLRRAWQQSASLACGSRDYGEGFHFPLGRIASFRRSGTCCRCSHVGAREYPSLEHHCNSCFSCAGLTVALHHRLHRQNWCWAEVPHYLRHPMRQRDCYSRSRPAVLIVGGFGSILSLVLWRRKAARAVDRSARGGRRDMRSRGPLHIAGCCGRPGRLSFVVLSERPGARRLTCDFC
jgi:hypothetical protein